MAYLLLFVILFNIESAQAQVLVFPNNNKLIGPLSVRMLKFISNTLHESKPALHLDCDVKVREITEERRFSDGIRRIDMLEIIFRSKNLSVPPEKFYFAVGSTRITKEHKVSKFSGPVEEIQLETEDNTNSRFVFQHNGQGEIIWMTFEDDLKTTPCRLNIR
jgi:hypothetical protein